MNILSTLASNEKSSERTIPKKIIQLWTFVGFEASVWILGLIYLAFIHSQEVTHFTICPLANLGIEFCPGCGLGNSISYIFKGDLSSSIYSHPLGIFALLIVTFRIINIIKNNRRRYA